MPNTICPKKMIVDVDARNAATESLSLVEIDGEVSNVAIIKLPEKNARCAMLTYPAASALTPEDYQAVLSFGSLDGSGGLARSGTKVATDCAGFANLTLYAGYCGEYANRLGSFRLSKIGCDQHRSSG